MRKRKILRPLLLRPLLFFVIFSIGALNTTVVEAVSIIDTLSSKYLDGLDRVKSKRRAYLSSIKACQGIKKAKVKSKVVALTFDDGPNGKYTSEILDILRLNDIKATFFFIGRNIRDQQDMVRMVYDEGHIIGNHSYSHRYLARLSEKKIIRELKETSMLVEGIVGKYPLLFRPPYGNCSIKSAEIANNLGFKTIMWSAMVDDYNPDTTSEKIANNITNLVTPGTIIGLHDGGGNRAKTVKALPIIIRALQDRGYEFLTIPELLDLPAYSSTYAKMAGAVREPAEKSRINVLQAKDLTLR